MLPRRIRRLAVLGALVGLLVTLPACSGDDPSGPGGSGGNQDAYVGTWTAQSFTVQGTDFIAMGMGLQATFTTSTYSLTVTDDIVGICDFAGTTDCTSTGDLSGTSSQVTFDPGTQDEVVFNYTVLGSSMTFSGSIDGQPVTIVFSKTS